MILDDEFVCPECWTTIDSLQDLCEDCIHRIHKEEDRLDREHEASEISQHRSQLI